MYRVESQFARSNAVRLGLIHVRRLYSNRTKSNRLSTHIAPSAHGYKIIPITTTRIQRENNRRQRLKSMRSRHASPILPTKLLQHVPTRTVQVKAHTTSIITQWLSQSRKLPVGRRRPLYPYPLCADMRRVLLCLLALHRIGRVRAETHA